MAVATPQLTAKAAVTVRVSQALGGDLADGARAQIERASGVSVDEIQLAGVQPGLNDTTVEATATLHVANPDEDAVADVEARLADAFGVDPERIELVDRREPG